MALCPPVPLWKRVLDVTCVLLALPVAGPLLLVIAAGIKLVSKGPILFCQPRVGHRGAIFTCLKFRTMRAHSGTKVHETHFKRLIRTGEPMTKLDSYGDPRLIPFGAMLRAAGLDELPQLINVLRGEMSLVGPRPCTPGEYDDYQPRHKRRCATLPGLTGLWQVSGKNKTTFDEMIEMDIRYTENSSLWLDVTIMARTIPVLVREVKDLRARRRQKARQAAAPAGAPVLADASSGFRAVPIGQNGRHQSAPARRRSKAHRHR